MTSQDSLAVLRRMAISMSATMPMSAHMLEQIIADIENSGPIASMIAEHPDRDDPLFCLRVLAGVSYLHVSGRAPQLSAHLAQLTTRQGEPAYNAQAWALFREALLGHPDIVRAAMNRPVQQHQPERAGVLLQGLALINASQVRLLELGACAGVNLLIDHYRWIGEGWEWGDSSSSLRLPAHGKPPGDFTIVERAGCDLSPRDPANAHDVAILRSFIPYERPLERRRLDAALRLAAVHKPHVDKSDAVEWLERRLANAGDPTVTTVVWHSLFWGYLPPTTQSALEEVMTAAGRRIPLVRVSYEPHEWLTPPRLQLTNYS